MHPDADSVPSVNVNVPFGQMVQTAPSSLSLNVPLGQFIHLGLSAFDLFRYVPTGHGTIKKKRLIIDYFPQTKIHQFKEIFDKNDMNLTFNDFFIYDNAIKQMCQTWGKELELSYYRLHYPYII